MTRTFSRRSFLKGTIAAAGVVAFPAPFVMADAQPNSRLNCVVVGCGRRGGEAHIGAAARERIVVAREALTHAEESLRIVQDRYDAGLTTIVELLDSEVALTMSRTNLTRTLYDATVSQARLDLSLGRLDRARF